MTQNPGEFSPVPGGPRLRDPWLPWLMSTLVVLLVAAGIGVFFLLKEDDPTREAASSSQDAAASSQESSASSQPTAAPSSTTSTEETEPSSEESAPSEIPGLVFQDSPEVAGAFVDEMFFGELAIAFTATTESLRGQYPGPQELANAFFTEVDANALIVSEFVYAGGANGSDEVAFYLDTDVGGRYVSVVITEEAGVLKVCRFVGFEAVADDPDPLGCSDGP